MAATELVICPTANGELAYQLVAALAIDPIPWSEKPLRVAMSAMTARKHRIFFMMLLFWLLFTQPIVISPIPTTVGNVLAIEWAHRDLLTIEVYRESMDN